MHDSRLIGLIILIRVTLDVLYVFKPKPIINILYIGFLLGMGMALLNNSKQDAEFWCGWAVIAAAIILEAYMYFEVALSKSPPQEKNQDMEERNDK
jgi:hypothetical protein